MVIKVKRAIKNYCGLFQMYQDDHKGVDFLYLFAWL